MQHFVFTMTSHISTHPNMKCLSYLGHALVLIHGHKLVAHAMNQKDGHSELSMIDFIPLRPVLAAHHGSQDKWRHIEGIALL